VESLVHSDAEGVSVPTEQAEKPVLVLTAEQIEAAMTPAGGYTKATLAGWGIDWPPPKGWKERLIAGEAFEPYVPEPVTEAEEAWSRALCVAADDDPERIVGCPALPLWRAYLTYARLAMKARAALETGSVGTKAKPECTQSPTSNGEG